MNVIVKKRVDGNYLEKIYNENFEITLKYDMFNYQIQKNNSIVETDSTDYSIHSAYLCESFLRNRSVHHLAINLVPVDDESGKPKRDVIIKKNITFNSNDLILTTIFKYMDGEIIVEDCYDPFGGQENPETEQGNIILGRP